MSAWSWSHRRAAGERRPAGLLGRLLGVEAAQDREHLAREARPGEQVVVPPARHRPRARPRRAEPAGQRMGLALADELVLLALEREDRQGLEPGEIAQSAADDRDVLVPGQGLPHPVDRVEEQL